MDTTTLTTKATYLIKLDPGELLLESIITHVQKYRITSGRVSAIGALGTAHVSFFDRYTRAYKETIFENVELVTCMGNIGIRRNTNESVVHLHATLTDEAGKAYGGHLNKGSVVSVTTEIFIQSYNEPIYRNRDGTTNLFLLDI